MHYHPHRAIIALAVILLQGCAPYMIVSTATTLVTGKPVADHVTTVASQADCNTFKFITLQQDYYCEVPRNAGTHYVRDGL